MEKTRQKPENEGDYLIIFVTILLSFAAYEYVKIFMYIIKSKSVVSLIQPQFFIFLSSFLFFIEYWWASYYERFHISKNLLWFLLILLQPIIFYLIATLLAPEVSEVKSFPTTFYNNFLNNRISIYVLGIILSILFAITSKVKLISRLNLFRLINIGLCISGICFGSITMQYVISISLLVFTIFFILSHVVGIFTI